MEGRVVTVRFTGGTADEALAALAAGIKEDWYKSGAGYAASPPILVRRCRLNTSG